MEQRDRYNKIFTCDFDFEDADTLVVSGGALKCIYFMGALAAVYDSTKRFEIKNYTSTSAGCFIAILLALGYRPFELFKRFVELRDVLIFSTLDHTVTTVGHLIVEKGFDRNITFEECFQATGKKLAFVTFNASRMRGEVFSKDTSPDTSLLMAARLSSSLPILFQPAQYNGCIYIDGIFSDNFPLKLAREFGDVKKVIGVTTRTGSYPRSIEEFYNDERFKIIMLDDPVKKWFFVSKLEKFKMFREGYHFVSSRIEQSRNLREKRMRRRTI